jgi:hypothetical protein
MPETTANQDLMMHEAQEKLFLWSLSRPLQIPTLLTSLLTQTTSLPNFSIDSGQFYEIMRVLM